MDGELRFGRQGTWRAVALLVALTVVAAGLVLAGVDPFTIWLLYPVGFVLASAYVLVAHRSDVMVVGVDGLSVERRDGRTLYRWEDLLEVGWLDGWYLGLSCSPVVRPRGDRFDVPGPNAAGVMGTLAIFGTAARRQARDALQDACRRHDVPFAERGDRMLSEGPPGSAFRHRPLP